MRVLKWDVKVDDQPHPIGAGRVLLVGCQGATPSFADLAGLTFQGDLDTVQVWTLEPRNGEPLRRVQAFGTGQDLEEWGSTIDKTSQRVRGYIGSAIAGPFVWHLFEVG